MKNLLLVFFGIVFLKTELALASKARLVSLANSFHLVDTQSVFYRPIDLIYLNNFVSVESGKTSPAGGQDNAEALASYAFKENHYLALAFGHQDRAVIESRSFINAVSGLTYEATQNPIHLFYAVDDSVTSYAIGAFYSSKNNIQAGLKESSAGLSLGVELGKIQISAVYVPTNKDELAGGKKFNGSGYIQTALSYLSEQTLFELKYKAFSAKSSTETAGVLADDESHNLDQLTLGLADLNPYAENIFFWGAQIITTRMNCKIKSALTCDKSFSRVTTPFWFGVEAEASDWLKFRGAIKQSFLFSLSKDEIGYPSSAIDGATGAVTEFGAGTNDTEVSMGLGFKMGQLTIDGTLSTASTQVWNSSNLLSQVSITHLF